jgi:hypothetical protein
LLLHEQPFPEHPHEEEENPFCDGRNGGGGEAIEVFPFVAPFDVHPGGISIPAPKSEVMSGINVFNKIFSISICISAGNSKTGG